MPQLTDEAIVLRAWEFSETSQTVSLLTRAHGVLRGLAKGSRRPRAPFDAGFEMLTRGHIGAIVRPTTELVTLTEWGLAEIFPRLRASLRAHRAAIYLADLTHHLVQPGDPHPALYEALVRCLRALDAEDRVLRGVLAYQWALLRETGYRPITDRDAATDEPLPTAPMYAFSAPAGGLTRDPGPGQASPGVWRVRADTVAVLIETDDAEGEPGEHLNNKGSESGREGRGGTGARVGRGGRGEDGASRLLSAYLGWILGRRLASADAWERIAALPAAGDHAGPEVK